MKTSKIIKKLEKLVERHGDSEFTIYKGFDKTTTSIKEDDIFFDDKLKDIYISIYN